MEQPAIYLKPNEIVNERISLEPMNLKMSLSCRLKGHVAKVFKAHVDKAVEELGVGYDVTLQGRFDKTPIGLEIVVTSKEEIP